MTTPHPTADPMVPSVHRVARRRSHTPDTFTLWLEPTAEQPGFLPGQFNMLYAFGSGEVPISISGDPGRSGAWVHTIRSVGPVTRALARARKGDPVGVRGPFGSSWPVDDARGKDLLVIAGGIGLAPLRPVLYWARRQKKRLGRVFLAYGARTPGDLLYTDELTRFAKAFDVHVSVDRGDPGWTGETGVVTKLLPRLGFDRANAVAFVCGPEVMMRFVTRELMQLGLPDSGIWVSTERNMKCAVALCGHCQLGTTLLCRDGPVYRWDRIAPLLRVKEL